MTIREQVAQTIFNEHFKKDHDYDRPDTWGQGWKSSEDKCFLLADQILPLIIAELTVIGDEEAKTVILKHCSPETKACDVVYTDIERALAQLQHAHTIKQLRGE